MPGQRAVRDDLAALLLQRRRRPGASRRLIAHAYETVPAPKTLLVPIVIERVGKGRYGFHVEVKMPEIAGGYGAPTLAEAKVGAIRKRGGKKVGFINAHCSGGRLQVEGEVDVHQRRPLPRHPHLAMSHPRLSLVASSRRAGARGRRRQRQRRPGRSRRHRPARRRRLPTADAARAPLRPDRLPGPARHHQPRRRQAARRCAKRWSTSTRDGRLSVAGLPTCAPDSIDEASTEEARRICRGRSSAPATSKRWSRLQEGTVRANSPLTIFNGPRLDGLPDRRPPRPHHRSRHPDLRDRRPDRTTPR